jgi:sigma-E factor negative regulatory protein RseA
MNPLQDTDRHAPSGELVSALCDGGLDPQELDALLARSPADEAMLAQWHGYQLIGEVLRGQPAVLPTCAPSVFLERVHAGLGHIEPRQVPVAAEVNALPQVRGKAANDTVFRWKLASGFASVVAVAAIGWNVLNSSTPAGVPTGAELAQGAPVVIPAAAPSAPPVVAAVPNVESRAVVVSTPQGRVVRDAALERLLAEHRQHGGMSAFQTSTGFIRNATYDADAR